MSLPSQVTFSQLLVYSSAATVDKFHSFGHAAFDLDVVTIEMSGQSCGSTPNMLVILGSTSATSTGSIIRTAEGSLDLISYNVGSGEVILATAVVGGVIGVGSLPTNLVSTSFAVKDVAYAPFTWTSSNYLHFYSIFCQSANTVNYSVLIRFTDTFTNYVVPTSSGPTNYNVAIYDSTFTTPLNPLPISLSTLVDVNVVEVNSEAITNPLPVSTGGGGVQDVNIVQVNNETITNPLPVTNSPTGVQQVDIVQVNSEVITNPLPVSTGGGGIQDVNIVQVNSEVIGNSLPVADTAIRDVNLVSINGTIAENPLNMNLAEINSVVTTNPLHVLSALTDTTFLGGVSVDNNALKTNVAYINNTLTQNPLHVNATLMSEDYLLTASVVDNGLGFNVLGTAFQTPVHVNIVNEADDDIANVVSGVLQTSTGAGASSVFLTDPTGTPLRVSARGSLSIVSGP